MSTVSTWPKIEYGGGTKKPTIIFLAGFPDDQESPWGPNLRSAITDKFHAVFLCMPGFEKNEIPRPWGYNFDELVDMLHSTIEAVTKRDEQIYLVGHDWGAILAMRYQNKFPDKVKKLTLVDVGMLTIKTAEPSQLAFILMYQLWYGICYIVGQIFSKWLATIMIKLFTLPIFSPLFVGVEEGRQRMQDDKDIVLRCYVYYQMWRAVATGTMKDPKMPSCPILFLYGSKKRFMFHSKKFIEKLSARADCTYLAVPCGHWVGVAQEIVTLEEILRFCS